MLEFDIILGMNCLHEFYATIDYRNMVGRLQLPNKLEFKCEGCGSNQIIQIVSNLKVNKMLFKGLGAYENFLTKRFPLKFYYRQVKLLRNKEVSIINMLWRNKLFEGPTWEADADMRSRYSHLFSS